MLKFKNGRFVDECPDCWGSCGCKNPDGEWEICDYCDGTGYDHMDYMTYINEQEEIEAKNQKPLSPDEQ